MNIRPFSVLCWAAKILSCTYWILTSWCVALSQYQLQLEKTNESCTYQIAFKWWKLLLKTTLYVYIYICGPICSIISKINFMYYFHFFAYKFRLEKVLLTKSGVRIFSLSDFLKMCKPYWILFCHDVNFYIDVFGEYCTISCHQSYDS